MGWLLFVVLTEKVSFKAMFQRGNRIQVPKRVRWYFKMDSSQVLKVSLKVAGAFTGRESFYAQMGKDGRITIPTIQRELLTPNNENSLEHHIIEATLEPT